MDQTKDLRLSAVAALTNQLRCDLLDGTIPAGSRILPRNIAERFSVSLVPVREALSHLEAEGLVTTSRQRATYAADIGVEELAGVYELRRVIEPEFAARAARQADAANHNACRDALATLVGAAPYSLEFFAAHRAFHWSLLEPAAKPIVKTVLERLWHSVDRYLTLGVKRMPGGLTDAFVANFHDAHRELADAYCAGDAASLRRLLLAHFVSTEDFLRELLNDMSDIGDTKVKSPEGSVARN